MGKIIRSYALDPPVAEWLDRHPDGRGRKRSRSMLVSEAVYYYWMSETELMDRIKGLRKANEIYLAELRELRARKGLLSRLWHLLRKRE